MNRRGGILVSLAALLAACGETTSPGASPSNSADPTAGWLTFHSSTEPLSFKYPADWKVTRTGTVDPGNSDGLTLTSPDGKMTIRWSALVSGLGGVCSTSCYNIVSVAPVAGAPCCFLVAFQSIAAGSSLQYGITDTAPALGAGPPPYPYYALFKSHNHKDSSGNYNEMWLLGDASDTTKEMLSSLVYS